MPRTRFVLLSAFEKGVWLGAIGRFCQRKYVAATCLTPFSKGCFSLTLLAGLLAFAGAVSAVSAAKKADRWEGTYLQYGRFETERQGQFNEARAITIKRHGNGYRLSAPYEAWTFTEVEKGVLSDGKGGIGKIYLGSAEFADGKRVPVLRAEFCYEWFILYGDTR